MIYAFGMTIAEIVRTEHCAMSDGTPFMLHEYDYGSFGAYCPHLNLFEIGDTRDEAVADLHASARDIQSNRTSGLQRLADLGIEPVKM